MNYRPKRKNTKEKNFDWTWVWASIITVIFVWVAISGTKPNRATNEHEQVEKGGSNTATEKQVIVIPDDDPPSDSFAKWSITAGIARKLTDGSIKASGDYREIKITDRRTVKVNGTYLFWFGWEETGTGQGLCYGEICIKRSGTEWAVQEFYCFQRK